MLDETYKIEDFDVEWLTKIDHQIETCCEMSRSERDFVNGLVRKTKPKKIVELGVAAGGSSAVILNAISDRPEAHLFSVDTLEKYYAQPDLPVGYVAQAKMENAATQWTLYTKKIAAQVLDQIGPDIDLCLLDTAHSNPGEFLDYLSILPYMKKNGIIIIHDTALFAVMNYEAVITCCTLFSAIRGKKLYPARTERVFFPNIGAVILDNDVKDDVFAVFNLLRLFWNYMPPESQLEVLGQFYKDHYGEQFASMFADIVRYQQIQMKTNEAKRSEVKNIQQLEARAIRAETRLRNELTRIGREKQELTEKIKSVMAGSLKADEGDWKERISLNTLKYEDHESYVLDKVEEKIKSYSEMSKSERLFLNGLIRKNKPKKILEIGTAAGGSSAIILNAIADDKEAHLFSVDVRETYYKDPELAVGHIANRVMANADTQWTLFTNHIAPQVMDQIGGGIDLCLLDTVHTNPGEFLDYLSILPYMKPGGLIVIHDTALFATMDFDFRATTCCTLFSAIKGFEKIIPHRSEHQFYSNIGAVVLADDAMRDAFSVFNLLRLPWVYMPSPEHLDIMEVFFRRHYGDRLAEMYVEAVNYQKFQLRNKHEQLSTEKQALTAQIKSLLDSWEIVTTN